ncbi:MAG: alpha/beta fold hydrolase [Candidatus Moraniibacteriota bacterium]
MQKNIQNINPQTKDPLYLIVPGFMGNYTEGFIKKIYNFILKKHWDVYGIQFAGHGATDKYLANPKEMVSHLKQEYAKIKKMYPLKKIIIIAHSQGCAITLKAHTSFKKNTQIILLAPAIFIAEIILPRIDKNSIQLIKGGQEISCQVSKDKFRTLNKQWVTAYEKFDLTKSLSNIKQSCLIIRPTNDFIPQKNIHFLKKEINKNSVIELEGNHWFDEPLSSFDNLVSKIFKC